MLTFHKKTMLGNRPAGAFYALFALLIRLRINRGFFKKLILSKKGIKKEAYFD
jgi:hypothetical protein